MSGRTEGGMDGCAGWPSLLLTHKRPHRHGSPAAGLEAFGARKREAAAARRARVAPGGRGGGAPRWEGAEAADADSDAFEGWLIMSEEEPFGIADK